MAAHQELHTVAAVLVSVVLAVNIEVAVLAGKVLRNIHWNVLRPCQYTLLLLWIKSESATLDYDVSTK